MQGQCGTFPVKILYEQSESTRLKIIFLCDYSCIWRCALNLSCLPHDVTCCPCRWIGRESTRTGDGKKQVKIFSPWRIQAGSFENYKGGCPTTWGLPDTWIRRWTGLQDVWTWAGLGGEWGLGRVRTWTSEDLAWQYDEVILKFKAKAKLWWTRCHKRHLVTPW